MCILRVEGRTAIMDCAMCPYEYTSADCINSHFKHLAMLTEDFDRMRYEEEILVEFEREHVQIIKEYISIAKQLEAFVMDPSSCGHKQDDYYSARRMTLNNMLEDIYKNPLLVVRRIDEYKEPEPMRGIFLEGYRKFFSILHKIREVTIASKMYQLTLQSGDMRDVFVSFAGMKTAAFVPTLTVGLPPEARPLDKPEARYKLPYGVEVEVYELVGKEANFYLQKNTILSELSPELRKILRQTIAAHMEPILDTTVDYSTMYLSKMLEYRRTYMEYAMNNKISITPEQALAMAKETVDWTVGLGAPLENLALDSDNITDIYIDSENAPLYIEHMYFGTCHTPWRYNRKLLEYSFLNATLGAKAGKRLDEKNPLIDVVLKRLNMRCHLQGPPATFGEIQGAFRIMKPTPFTYAEYLFHNAMTPFFAGYDDTMVSLGCSEAVMGVKGCGKTSFTAAKIAAIGTKRRIIPVQDIEEIPVLVYRKRGFHIGAAKVAEEEEEKTALSLVRMTSGLLRMGDAAIIINEMRSRTAIQGVINLLNTQPGVFILYNFHAESLKDVQDRLELVFGIPSAAMFATDRYTFLHKYRFGRKERIYRVLNKSYETDIEERKFVETFMFKRGTNILNSILQCGFLKNPEASAWDIHELDLGKMEKELSISYVPPALQRRSNDTGISVEQYLMQAFFKGKVYAQLNKDAERLKNKSIRELDFVIKCSATANNILKQQEKENGTVDFKDVQKIWDETYKKLLDDYIKGTLKLGVSEEFEAGQTAEGSEGGRAGGVVGEVGESAENATDEEEEKFETKV
ncbi:MAG: ATPase, T2SS/T4P/T4SS family [Candidatus Micrarchaeia archaeon]